MSQTRVGGKGATLNLTLLVYSSKSGGHEGSALLVRIIQCKNTKRERVCSSRVRPETSFWCSSGRSSTGPEEEQNQESERGKEERSKDR